ncbi:hypothetical protein [Leptolyngbya sp. 7M]|uniref:hypothetical protein n=1 Tax=Leptolyngbya sp. 7M TaxID=2812896 RepID=UPI001B8C9B28|nr:hypothetical protein [Leptolyngbya sp. 7M]QYO64110.1 hypothetical protein JVX88_30825 [Leptolyngbya sp. 7M]
MTKDRAKWLRLAVNWQAENAYFVELVSRPSSDGLSREIAYDTGIANARKPEIKKRADSLEFTSSDFAILPEGAVASPAR